MSRWRKAGVARLSNSRKVVLLAIYSLDSHQWLLVDAEKLLDLITGHALEVDIKESVPLLEQNT